MTTMISSNCIANTSICNGTYECGGETEMAVLARVVPLFRTHEEWSEAESYEALTIIRHGSLLYISKIPVPCNTPITDKKYWTVYAQSVDWERIQQMIDEGDDAVKVWAQEEIEKIAEELAQSDEGIRAELTAVDAKAQATLDALEATDGRVSELKKYLEKWIGEVDAKADQALGNTEALSSRLDEIEGNGGDGLSEAMARLDAVDAGQTVQDAKIAENEGRIDSAETEIAAVKMEMETAVEDINAAGEQAQSALEQVGQASDLLAKVIVRGGTTEAPTYEQGDVLAEWLANSGGSGDFKKFTINTQSDMLNIVRELEYNVGGFYPFDGYYLNKLFPKLIQKINQENGTEIPSNTKLAPLGVHYSSARTSGNGILSAMIFYFACTYNGGLYIAADGYGARTDTDSVTESVNFPVALGVGGGDKEIYRGTIGSSYTGFGETRAGNEFRGSYSTNNKGFVQISYRTSDAPLITESIDGITVVPIKNSTDTKLQAYNFGLDGAENKSAFKIGSKLNENGTTSTLFVVVANTYTYLLEISEGRPVSSSGNWDVNEFINVNKPDFILSL